VSVFEPGGFAAVATDAATSGQTDVFAVDTAGQLARFTTASAKHWRGYPPVSPQGFKAPSGAPLAVPWQFGLASQTDVFVADTTGAINVFYSHDGANWFLMQPPLTGAGAVPPGAPLAASQRFGVAAGQTDVYAVNTQGQIVCWSVVGGGAWSGPAPVSNSSSGFLAP
jgi:hypothetical protein